MEIIPVTISESPSTSYPIFIGDQITAHALKQLNLSHYSRAILIADTNTDQYVGAIRSCIDIPTHLITVSSGEAHKNIQCLSTIWSQMLQCGADRSSLVICVGGGVIGDMGGFAAATYMRGIDFIQIPTTLLAMVDASVGGKTAIDHEGVKNSIGSFQQPKAVIIDTQYLRSLPTREYASGFAEILKHGLIADKDYFDRVCESIETGKIASPYDFDTQLLQSIICESVQIKKKVVESDPTEKGLRKILNFGHTIGHAVEALSHEHHAPLLHGEAISIGLCAEYRLSQKVNASIPEDTKWLLKKSLELLSLPTDIPPVMTKDVLIQKMQHDKKNKKGEIRYILLDTVGHATADHTISNELLHTVLLSQQLTSI
jgi:3-dehydroquinate synthase